MEPTLCTLVERFEPICSRPYCNLISSTKMGFARADGRANRRARVAGGAEGNSLGWDLTGSDAGPYRDR